MTLVGIMAKGVDDDFYEAKIKLKNDEMRECQAIIDQYEADQKAQRNMERQIDDACAFLENEPLTVTEYDDRIVRQLVDTVKVMSKDKLIVVIKGNIEIEQMMPAT